MRHKCHWHGWGPSLLCEKVRATWAYVISIRDGWGCHSAEDVGHTKGEQHKRTASNLWETQDWNNMPQVKLEPRNPNCTTKWTIQTIQSNRNRITQQYSNTAIQHKTNTANTEQTTTDKTMGDRGSWRSSARNTARTNRHNPPAQDGQRGQTQQDRGREIQDCVGTATGNKRSTTQHTSGNTTEHPQRPANRNRDSLATPRPQQGTVPNSHALKFNAQSRHCWMCLPSVYPAQSRKHKIWKWNLPVTHRWSSQSQIIFRLHYVPLFLRASLF